MSGHHRPAQLGRRGARVGPPLVKRGAYRVTGYTGVEAAAFASLKRFLHALILAGVLVEATSQQRKLYAFVSLGLLEVFEPKDEAYGSACELTRAST